MRLRVLLARRLILMIPTLVVVIFVTFMLVRLGNEDPTARLAGPTATAAEIERLRAELGLDRGLVEQFVLYVGNVARGDFGRSWLSGKPVLEEIMVRLPATMELLLLGFGLAALVAIPVGLQSAYRQGRAFDHIARFIALLGFSIPTYWLGLTMLFVFFFILGWAPPGMGRLSLMEIPPPVVTGSVLIDSLLAGDGGAARSAFSQLVLPVICVAVISAAPLLKMTRAIAVDALESDYVRYAWAQGLSDRTVRRIAMRNSTAPVITFAGTEITSLVGSIALIEFVFAWGGFGQFGLDAIIVGDFTVVQGFILVLALFSIVTFILIDVVVALIEPRAELQ